jgi:hypothetical protein
MDRSGQIVRRKLAFRDRPVVPRLQSPHVHEDRVEPRAGDELHDVIMNAQRLADSEDGDDVRMVQSSGGLRLAVEAGHALGIEERGRGQDLERDAAAERLLLGLVDDAHPAPADLADDPIIGEPLGDGPPRPWRPSPGTSR